MLTKDKWELLAKLCEVLKGFAEATTYLGASKYVTHSIMSPLLKEIKKRVKLKDIPQDVNRMEEIIDVFEEEEEGEQAEENMSRSEEHTSELQSPYDLVCRLLLEKK